MTEQRDDQDPQETSASAAATSTTGADTDALDAMRKEKDALQERLLRTAAEFDNYRKRVDRERRETAEFVGAEILADVLPVVDDLERALQAPSGSDAESYRKGVELIHKQMLDVLRKRGVKPIPTAGEQFDPRVHEAVMQESSSEHREGEIMAELRRGYMLGDRLLRAAVVKVATA